MSRVVLDQTKRASLTISTDAFYFLYFDEECLDELNMVDVHKLKERYPLGFEIAEYMVEATGDKTRVQVIPYIEDPLRPTHFQEMSKYTRLDIRLEGDTVYYRWANCEKEPEQLREVHKVPVKISNFKKRYFSFESSPDISMIYLEHFSAY